MKKVMCQQQRLNDLEAKHSQGTTYHLHIVRSNRAEFHVQRPSHFAKIILVNILRLRISLPGGAMPSRVNCELINELGRYVDQTRR